MVVRGSAWEGGLLDVRQRDACVEGSGNESVPECVGPYRLGDPGAASHAADDTRGTVPVQPSAIGGEEDRAFTPLANRKVDSTGGARGKGMVTILPPLRVMVSVRWPRSWPRASVFAPVASETLSPLSASSEISACSAAGPRPAATSRAPSSLRSRPVACDS